MLLAIAVHDASRQTEHDAIQQKYATQRTTATDIDDACRSTSQYV
jgi:hypothetical protein